MTSPGKPGADVIPDGTDLLHAHHGHGISYRDLGARHGLNHERIRQLVIAAEDEIVFRVMTDFVTALRDEAAGRTAEWPSLIIPNGPDRQTALRVRDVIDKRLKTQGLPVQTITKGVPANIVGGGIVMSWVLDQAENERREAAKNKESH
jgi:hypothetical protein